MMEKKAHLAGILFAVIFGFTFMFSKMVLNLGYITPMGLIAYRFLAAFIVFEILRLCKLVKIEFKKANLKLIFLVVIFQPVLYFIFEAYGIKITNNSGETGLMIALIPLFVTIFSALILKEKPKGIQILFILLSFSGVVVIQIADPDFGLNNQFIGLIILFFAVISAALFNIASRNASKNISPYTLTYFMMMSGAIAFNLIYLVQLLIESRISDYLLNMRHIEILFPILYLGVIASIGGFFLVNYTLSKLPAHVSSVYSNIATVIAILAGAFLLGEEMNIFYGIGATMIILGVYGNARFNYRAKKRVDALNDQYRK